MSVVLWVTQPGFRVTVRGPRALYPPSSESLSPLASCRAGDVSVLPSGCPRVGALLSDVPSSEGGGTQNPICLACSWALLPAHTAVAGQPPGTLLLGPAATPSPMPG